jgi:hypothetical protein
MDRRALDCPIVKNNSALKSGNSFGTHLAIGEGTGLNFMMGMVNDLNNQEDVMINYTLFKMNEFIPLKTLHSLPFFA